LEQYAAVQVIAALQRGDELAFNPDVLRLDIPNFYLKEFLNSGIVYGLGDK
jgi:hypothetical protein